VVHKGPQGGTLRVSIDGQASEDIVLQSDASKYGVFIPLARGLRYGAHRVEMVTSSAPGMQVDIDGLVVRRSQSVWLSYTIIPTAIVAALLLSKLRKQQPITLLAKRIV